MALSSAYCVKYVHKCERFWSWPWNGLSWIACHLFYRWSGHWMMRWRMATIKTGNRAGTMIHTCFTKVSVLKVLVSLPLQRTAVDMSSWRSLRILMYFSGHPHFYSIVQRAWLFTKSNALVRSLKPMYSGSFCALHFSCLPMTIMTLVPRAWRKLHWDSGRISSDSWRGLLKRCLHNLPSCGQEWDAPLVSTFCLVFLHIRVKIHT